MGISSNARGVQVGPLILMAAYQLLDFLKELRLSDPDPSALAHHAAIALGSTARISAVPPPN